MVLTTMATMAMQKRRAGGGGTTTLPAVVSSTTNGKHPQLNGENHAVTCGPQFWSFVILIVMAWLGVFVMQQFTEGHMVAFRQLEEEAALPFSQFPTLNYALQNAEMVGLYFAASWCPMSTPVTKLLGEAFPKDTLLPPEDSFSIFGEEKHKFAIVYVSSDHSKEEMEAYMKPNWIGVDFDSEERVALKKHFSACAKAELAELEIDRKYEIPTLMIFDGAATHGLLSTQGAQQLLRQHKHDPLTHWQQLQQRMRDAEKKFAI